MANFIFRGYTEDPEVQYLIYTETTYKEKFEPHVLPLCVKREPLISTNWNAVLLYAVKHTKEVADQPI